MIIIALYLSLIYFGFANYIDLSSVGEILSNGFNLAVSSPRDRRGSDAHFLLLPLRVKRRGLIILLGFILSTLCHHTSCITLFVMNLIRREASIEVLSKWSTSGR